MKILFIASLGILSLTQTSIGFADNANGKNLYLQRCSMCHGTDLKATGDFTKTMTFKVPGPVASA
jgi:mono/diheme cytochrome c family protein